VAIVPAALTDAATILTDAALGNHFHVTLNVAGATRILGNPTNMVAGQNFLWRVQQDAAGSRALTYGTAFRHPGGVAPSLSALANAVDYLAGYSPDGVVVNLSIQRDFR
jgi:hypothetical protein